MVSHDRYLLERVTDEQFALIGGKVRHLPGGVQDYLDMMEQLKRGEDPLGLEGAAGGPATGGDSPANGGGSADAASAATTTEPEAPKLSGKAYADASRRVSAIERKLEKIATQKEQLEAQMAAHDPSDYAGLNELNGQLQALAAESDGLEAEWLDLSEQMGQ